MRAAQHPERAFAQQTGAALYGTTLGGGANDKGTVFEVTTSGQERVLYAFKGGTADGDNPRGGLVAFNGALYGATSPSRLPSRRRISCCSPRGCSASCIFNR